MKKMHCVKVTACPGASREVGAALCQTQAVLATGHSWAQQPKWWCLCKSKFKKGFKCCIAAESEEQSMRNKL